ITACHSSLWARLSAETMLPAVPAISAVPVTDGEPGGRDEPMGVQVVRGRGAYQAQVPGLPMESGGGGGPPPGSQRYEDQDGAARLRRACSATAGVFGDVAERMGRAGEAAAGVGDAPGGPHRGYHGAGGR